MTRIPIDDTNVENPNFQDDGGAATGGAAGKAGAGGTAGPQGSAGASADELSRLRTERDSLFERLARVSADFQNTRKRLEAETDQRMQYANSGLIKALLPVIDNFERALAVDPSKADAASVLKGLQIVHDQMMMVLRAQNVEEVAPQPGEKFDPTRHEALMQQPTASPTPEPVVTQLLQKGYALHDRTLRPAQVAVSKTT